MTGSLLEDEKVIETAATWTEPLLPAGLQIPRPPRVLIVDDDREIRSLLEETLSEEGYRPLTAPDSLSALILLLGEGADILVTDWKMPTSDGLDLLDSVRRCAPDIPVIFLTAYADDLLRQQAMSRGAFGFLGKPFRRAEFLASLKRATELVRRGRAGGPGR
jgi:CheY-like chemotaxis protein